MLTIPATLSRVAADVRQIYAVREILERAAAAQIVFPLSKTEHRAMLKALREGDRKRLIELCAARLDISRQA